VAWHGDRRSDDWRLGRQGDAADGRLPRARGRSSRSPDSVRTGPPRSRAGRASARARLRASARTRAHGDALLGRRRSTDNVCSGGLSGKRAAAWQRQRWSVL
jgi:hypothetical protein